MRLALTEKICFFFWPIFDLDLERLLAADEQGIAEVPAALTALPLWYSAYCRL
jgi:hypothetical protein